MLPVYCVLRPPHIESSVRGHPATRSWPACGHSQPSSAAASWVRGHPGWTVRTCLISVNGCKFQSGVVAAAATTGPDGRQSWYLVSLHTHVAISRSATARRLVFGTPRRAAELDHLIRQLPEVNHQPSRRNSTLDRSTGRQLLSDDYIFSRLQPWCSRWNGNNNGIMLLHSL